MKELAEIQKTVAPIASRYGVEKMVLFGSRARGEAHSGSDYDFLITRGQLKSLWQFSAFWTELEKACHAPVDVVSDTSFDEELIGAARKDGLLVYERKG